MAVPARVMRVEVEEAVKGRENSCHWLLAPVRALVKSWEAPAAEAVTEAGPTA